MDRIDFLRVSNRLYDVSKRLQFVSSRLVSKRLCIEMTELRLDQYQDQKQSGGTLHQPRSAAVSVRMRTAISTEQMSGNLRQVSRPC